MGQQGRFPLFRNLELLSQANEVGDSSNAEFLHQPATMNYYLHRLFQHDGITVAAWIREQRLERARRDLADPALRAVPVHQIAARWGFSHAAVFSRAFRAGYGVAPNDYRHQTLRTVDASSTVGYQPSTTS